MTSGTYEPRSGLNSHHRGITSGNRDTVPELAALHVLCNQIGYI